jgi:hypothetical protein
VSAADAVPTIDELLDRPCPACGGYGLIIRDIEIAPPTLTLRCLQCGHTQHNVRYRLESQ